MRPIGFKNTSTAIYLSLLILSLLVVGQYAPQALFFPLACLLTGASLCQWHAIRGRIQFRLSPQEVTPAVSFLMESSPNHTGPASHDPSESSRPPDEGNLNSETEKEWLTNDEVESLLRPFSVSPEKRGKEAIPEPIEISRLKDIQESFSSLTGLSLFSHDAEGKTVCDPSL